MSPRCHKGRRFPRLFSRNAAFDSSRSRSGRSLQGLQERGHGPVPLDPYDLTQGSELPPKDPQSHDRKNHPSIHILPAHARRFLSYTPFSELERVIELDPGAIGQRSRTQSRGIPRMIPLKVVLVGIDEGLVPALRHELASAAAEVDCEFQSALMAIDLSLIHISEPTRPY